MLQSELSMKCCDFDMPITCFNYTLEIQRLLFKKLSSISKSSFQNHRIFSHSFKLPKPSERMHHKIILTILTS